MSKHYFPDLKLIKFCKVCRVEYRPPRHSYHARLGLCHKHRVEWVHQQWLKNGKEYHRVYRKVPAHKARLDILWKNWVIKNIIRRRKNALASYHRRKHLHKARRHRATILKKDPQK